MSDQYVYTSKGYQVVDPGDDDEWTGPTMTELDDLIDRCPEFGPQGSEDTFGVYHRLVEAWDAGDILSCEGCDKWWPQAHFVDDEGDGSDLCRACREKGAGV